MAYPSVRPTPGAKADQAAIIRSTSKPGPATYPEPKPLQPEPKK